MVESWSSMYLLELHHENAKLNGSGRISFRCGPRDIRKWTLLDDGARSVEQARLVATVCLGGAFLPLARRFTPALCRSGAGGLQLEFLFVRHPPRDCIEGSATQVGGCFRLLPGGDLKSLDKRQRCFLKSDVAVCNSRLGSGIRKHFALAYGPRWLRKAGKDRFDFAEPHRQRFQRIQSVFDHAARLDVVLLVDVDGRMPNLALMKLGGWLRRQGRKVMLVRHGNWQIDTAERVYASCVFNLPSSKQRVAGLRERFRDKLSIGGSGVDLQLRLPAEIEAAPADYGLYRELAERGIRVNFNQTLDINLVDTDRAALLRRIDCANYGFTRSVYHFSLNNAKRLDRIRRNYNHFGFHSRENVEFICMYGFNTTLAEDVERFRFLRSLPGAYVFVQEYKPPLGGTRPRLDAFFDNRAYDLIEELIGIVFPQNMKSMEKYYRWLSQRYLDTFGELHDPLVDTIFRYNFRDRKALYIAKMLGTKGKNEDTASP